MFVYVENFYLKINFLCHDNEQLFFCGVVRIQVLISIFVQKRKDKRLNYTELFKNI